jgi:zinc D-Ala-D-Ala carboxypeptidase
MQLSKHFTLREMTNSMTAQRKGIDNTPGSAEIKSLGDLCYEVLEPLRAWADKPVTITSGYRSEALCEAIGSKKTSQHAKGQAVDLEIFGVPNIKTAYWLQNNVDFDQLIMEYYDKDDPAGGWVHIIITNQDQTENKFLPFDGKKYTEGLPDMEWKDGKVVG